jgi:hypothetical protein
MMRSVPMNWVRALLICTHPSDYAPTRVREAARHLQAQGDGSEKEKQLASEALKSLQPATHPMPQRTRSSPGLRRGYPGGSR